MATDPYRLPHPDTIRADQRKLVHRVLIDAWSAADEREDWDAGEDIKEALDILGLPHRRLTRDEAA